MYKRILGFIFIAVVLLVGIPATEEKKLVHVAYSNSNHVLSYLLEKRMFDNDYYEYRVVLYKASIFMLSELAKGNVPCILDFSEMLSTYHLSKTESLVVAYAVREGDALSSLVMQGYTNVTDPSKLNQRGSTFRIAVVQGSTSHRRAFDAFHVFNININRHVEMKYLFEDSDFIEEWDRGTIDGYFHDSLRVNIHAAKTGGAVVIKGDDVARWTTPTIRLLVCNREFVEEDPGAVQRLVDVFVATWKNAWQSDHSRLGVDWQLWSSSFNSSLRVSFGDEQPEDKFIASWGGRVPLTAELQENEWIRYDQQLEYLNHTVIRSMRSSFAFMVENHVIDPKAQVYPERHVNVTFIQNAFSGSLEYKDLVPKSYVKTWEVQEELCPPETNVSAAAIEVPQKLVLYGNVSSDRTCTYNFKIPNHKNVLHLHFDYFWVDNGMDIISTSTKLPLFRASGFERTLSDLYFQENITIIVKLEENSEHKKLYGFGPFDLAYNQGVNITYTLTNAPICVQDSDCGGEERGVCVNKLCQCKSGYSGSKCEIDHCRGTLHQHSKSGELVSNGPRGFLPACIAYGWYLLKKVFRNRSS